MNCPQCDKPYTEKEYLYGDDLESCNECYKAEKND